MPSSWPSHSALVGSFGGVHKVDGELVCFVLVEPVVGHPCGKRRLAAGLDSTRAAQASRVAPEPHGSVGVCDGELAPVGREPRGEDCGAVRR